MLEDIIHAILADHARAHLARGRMPDRIGLSQIMMHTLGFCKGHACMFDTFEEAIRLGRIIDRMRARLDNEGWEICEEAFVRDGAPE